MSMYADDMSICHQSSDIAQLNGAINSDLALVEKWLKGNKLSLNVMKTHAMLISTKPKHKTLMNQGESLKLKIRNDELEVVQRTKYLGVQIDSGLDWKEHIKTVSSKVSKSNWLFETCKIISARKDSENYVHRYCGAAFSLLLFCLGLLWSD